MEEQAQGFSLYRDFFRVLAPSLPEKPPLPMKPALFVIALVMAWYSGQATAGLFQEYVVHGQSKSCYSISGLDQALSTENVAYFKDWADKDFDDAAVWAKACKNSGWQFAGANRVERLRHFQEVLKGRQRQANIKTIEANAAKIVNGPDGMQVSCKELRYYRSHIGGSIEFGKRQMEWTPEMIEFLKSTADSCVTIDYISQQDADFIKSELATTESMIEKEKAIQKKREAVRMATEQKQRQLNDCQATKAYQLYQAQESIIGDLEQKAGWKRNLDHERKITSVSGVRNLSEEYNAGAWIVQLDDDLKQNWATYKQLGGKAANPQSVKHQLANPCTSLEQSANTSSR